jgi:DNA-binding MarR family transcriptional regulator
MLERGLLSRERTEEDQRANAVAITQGGRRALRAARLSADRAERALLEPLPVAERARFVKALSLIAAAADKYASDDAPRPQRKTRSKRT